MPHTCTKMNTTSRLHTLIIYTWWTRMNKTSPLVSGVKVLSEYAISISFYTMINWILFSHSGESNKRKQPAFPNFSKVSKAELFSVLLGPISGGSIVLLPFIQVLLGDVADQRASWIAILHQATDRQQQFGNGQGGSPGVFQSIHTDFAIITTVDVAVVNLCPKIHL